MKYKKIKKCLNKHKDNKYGKYLNKYKKEDMLVIGSMSGLAGQSNKDSLMAERFGVDYLDIGQLLTMYF